MAIDLTKVPLLSHVQYLYGDLRDRIKEKYSKPEEGIPASDLAPGVIPDIGLIENEKAPIIMETASGNPIVITDGAAGLPLSECKLTLLPRQSGSGDASPDNVRPLVPWENVGMWTSGANTWNEQWEVGTISIETGENVVANDRIRAKDYNPCIPNKTYFIVDPTHGKNIRLFYYDEEKNFVGDSGWKDSEITTPSNAYFFRFIVAASYGTEYKNDIAINYPSNVTTYAHTTSHPVDLTGITPSIYGCEINPITGEVWGTHRRQVFDGDEVLNVYGSYTGGIRLNSELLDDAVQGDRNAKANEAILEWDVPSTIERLGFRIGGGSGKLAIFIPNSMFDGEATAAKFKTWLNGNNLEICYTLATPVLLTTLTPQEISTLLGTNTIWSDADSIDIEYRADTELFINQNGVKDVQLNGASVTTDGVANIPKANANTFGVAKVSNGTYGLSMRDTGDVQVESSTEVLIKNAQEARRPIVPYRQHISTFYGLAKAAGADMAQSSNAVGTYTDAAKQGIQKMLGLDGLVGPYEADITADRAYAIGETFVMDGKRYKATAAIAQGGIITPGTNCELDPLDGRYVRNTDYPANSTIPGVVKVNKDGAYGLRVSSEIAGDLRVMKADDANIKSGVPQYKPIVPFTQHQSVFFGLSKAAGVDLANETVTVGTYPQNAKTAIQSMLGIEALPAVAAADNGKILQVVNGEWAAASIPNANGVSF